MSTDTFTVVVRITPWVEEYDSKSVLTKRPVLDANLSDYVICDNDTGLCSIVKRSTLDINTDELKNIPVMTAESAVEVYPINQNKRLPTLKIFYYPNNTGHLSVYFYRGQHYDATSLEHLDKYGYDFHDSQYVANMTDAYIYNYAPIFIYTRNGCILYEYLVEEEELNEISRSPGLDFNDRIVGWFPINIPSTRLLIDKQNEIPDKLPSRFLTINRKMYQHLECELDKNPILIRFVAEYTTVYPPTNTNIQPLYPPGSKFVSFWDIRYIIRSNPNMRRMIYPVNQYLVDKPDSIVTFIDRSGDAYLVHAFYDQTNGLIYPPGNKPESHIVKQNAGI